MNESLRDRFGNSSSEEYKSESDILVSCALRRDMFHQKLTSMEEYIAESSYVLLRRSETERLHRSMLRSLAQDFHSVKYASIDFLPSSPWIGKSDGLEENWHVVDKSIKKKIRKIVFC